MQDQAFHVGKTVLGPSTFPAYGAIFSSGHQRESLCLLHSVMNCTSLNQNDSCSKLFKNFHQCQLTKWWIKKLPWFFQNARLPSKVYQWQSHRCCNQRHCPQEVFDGFTYVLCRLVEPGCGGIAPGHHIGVRCLDSGEAAAKMGKENATMGGKKWSKNSCNVEACWNDLYQVFISLNSQELKE